MKILKNKLRNLGVMVMLFLIPGSLLAALPTAAAVAGGATTTAGPLTLLRELFSQGFGIVGAIIIVVITAGVMFTIYTAFLEGREKGKWKEFGLTAIVGVVIIVATIVMVTLAIGWLAP